jgi:hypothetical protein
MLDELDRVLRLMQKYADFRIYRRHGRQVVPRMTPR